MSKTFLALLAHPDDESFGPGGTLARYSAEGVDVHVVIATDGAAGSVAEGHESARENLVGVREKELAAAVKHLGVTLHKLNYRDSGMHGDPNNDHPDAWIRSDTEQAVRTMVKLIRELKPTVMLTHNENGDYFHPDHIRCCEVGTAAFHAAADPARFAELNLEPHQPEKLFYTAFSNRWTRFLSFLLRLQGKDPTAYGRNKDIDLTKVGVDPKRINTRISYYDYWFEKLAASKEHASQGGGGSRYRVIPKFMHRRLLSKDTFIRVYPVDSAEKIATSMFD